MMRDKTDSSPSAQNDVVELHAVNIVAGHPERSEGSAFFSREKRELH
ncbi:MAG TPA: hypothetical protein VLA17_07015 [Candidatus Limnocylindria bacterium]|nr:hypothetical protein [Candidatus Limnocylindria bacterium]